MPAHDLNIGKIEELASAFGQALLWEACINYTCLALRRELPLTQFLLYCHSDHTLLCLLLIYPGFLSILFCRFLDYLFLVFFIVLFLKRAYFNFFRCLSHFYLFLPPNPVILDYHDTWHSQFSLKGDRVAKSPSSNGHTLRLVCLGKEHR